MYQLVMIGIAFGSLALAQAPSFEVTSVRPSQDGAKNTTIRPDQGAGITFGSANLKTLVLMAYNIQDYQLVGQQSWMQNDRYDVIAKAPAGAERRDTWRMLQTLLADRFQLRVRRETREMPSFDLLVARTGAKLQEPVRPSDEADGSFRTTNGHMKCLRVGMDSLSFALAEVVGRRVVDQTGINGKFDVILDWSPEGPTIFTALTEQLGLRLEASRARVETVTIEHAERPAAN
jgi:uncharacterized protein (TIGR03435 family)